MARIYRQTSQCHLRESIIELMVDQSEREEAAVFLVGVAEEPGPPPAPGEAIVYDDATMQESAIAALTAMGQPGDAALRRLYALGTVREPNARATLDRIAARRGFARP